MTTISDEEILFDPKIDFVFKRIFGNSEHPRPLLDLLNAIFAAQNQPLIKDITVLNPALDQDWENDKSIILDIRASTRDGQAINVEMQMVNTGSFIKRTLYYWAELYGEALQKGDDYQRLRRTVAINFLNFNLFAHQRVTSLYQLYDSADQRLLTDLMQLVFIELSKTGQQALPNHLQQWLRFLTVRKPDELKQVASENPAIDEAYHMLSYLSQDPNERRRYFRRKLALMDFNSAIRNAKESGIEAGKIEGQVAVIKQLLQQRFGELPDWANEKLHATDNAQLKRWSERLFEATSLAEFFAE